MTKYRQSAAKPLSKKLYEEGSTTIPQGSTGSNSGKQPIYLKKRNVIYYIKCVISNKYYIGQASYYDKRIGTHVSLLRKNKHKNKHLQSAWNKYGEQNFIFNIIEEGLTKEEMFEKETFYINKFNALNRKFGYNICKETRNRKGCKMPESAKKAIGDFWRGKKFSKKRIKNLRESATKRQGKAILVFNKEMEFICEYKSISETARKLNVSIASISKQCSSEGGYRKRKDSKYIFRYKDIV